MNIVFYAYGFGHFFIESLLKNELFSSYFKNPKVFIITDNRTHKYFFDKKGWNTLYLTDFKKENDSKYNSSDNFIISMRVCLFMEIIKLSEE